MSEYELTAEGKHGWEIKYKARVKECELALPQAAQLHTRATVKQPLGV